MNLTQRINDFSQIGYFLKEFLTIDFENDTAVSFHSRFYLELKKIVETYRHYNAWFTKENILYALSQWKEALIEENLSAWLSPYHLTDQRAPKTIGVIMAGNIPMVGFHDLLSTLICGHKAKIKLSSKDHLLLPFFIRFLCYIRPQWEKYIQIVENQLTDFDAVIATGSNNTSRYFQYYFSKYPRIIRKNRISAAVLTGNESERDLRNLGEDIFRYFGLGCRNVSKIFVPKHFDLNGLLKRFSPFREVMDHHTYRNNYDYYKTVFLMNRDKIIDNGFIILKEDQNLYSPIGTLFYEYYKDLSAIKDLLKREKDKIQCVVSQSFTADEISFGQTQKPALNQYADGVDTLAFLNTLA